MGDAAAFRRAADAIRAVLARPAVLGEQIPHDVPVTIAWGARDRLLPPRQLQVAAQRLPQAKIMMLPGCGHVPMSDDPALVARVLLAASEGQGRRCAPTTSATPQPLRSRMRPNEP